MLCIVCTIVQVPENVSALTFTVNGHIMAVGTAGGDMILFDKSKS